MFHSGRVALLLLLSSSSLTLANPRLFHPQPPLPPSHALHAHDGGRDVVKEGGGKVEGGERVRERQPTQDSQWLNGTLSHLPDNSLTQDKDGRFIFTVIKFPNILCGSGIDSGTCFTKIECLLNGGTVVGSCARGYGVCCQAKLAGCGGYITVNNTIITNTEYGSTFNEGRSCLYKVAFDDTTNEICQIRYDFIEFDMVAPTTQGVCSTDKLVFETDKKSAYFCGKTPSNYHWYVETAGTTSPQSLAITTDGTTSYNRKYAIRISTIPCMQEVPTYCGQYFDGTSGTITSFNYGNGVYLAGLMYSICFQKEKGYCTYTLEKTSDIQFIGTPDMLRFPMGTGIAVEANTGAFGSAFLCPLATTQASTLYYTANWCHYPPSMTSNNKEAAFYVSISTLIDTIDNRNQLATTYSGFDFNWKTNTC